MKVEANAKLKEALEIDTVGNENSVDVNVAAEKIADAPLNITEALTACIEGFDVNSTPLAGLDVDHNSGHVQIEAGNDSCFDLDFFASNNGAKVVDFDINKKAEVKEALDVDGLEQKTDIELQNDISIMGDIVLDQVVEPELEGCDEIILEDTNKLDKIDDISLEGGMILD